MIAGQIAEAKRRGLPYVYLGYWIDASHQGQGLMTEAAEAVTTYAFRVLDNLMRDGRIEQAGTPEDVFKRPASRFEIGRAHV